MTNVIIEVQDDRVTVAPVLGKGKEFAEVAHKLTELGNVTTATGDRGIVLVTDVDTAKSAGLIKATRTNRKKED